MPEPNGGLNLPQPEKAQLEAFSLFEREACVETDFARAPVFCLVGANGLGKSTFLAAVSFAMTGVVAQPGSPFRGAGEYYKKTKPYAARYFRGRIGVEDADSAQITLTMKVGEKRYELTRGMFDPEGLRALQIFDASGKAILENADELDEGERHRIYVENVVQDVGLDDFAQLVFLQLFVLSFDERRELLFWTPRLMQNALYISFGLDPERAAKAEKLGRRVEALESRARNAQWQATNVRKQLEALQETGEELLEEASDKADEQKRLEELREEAAADTEAAAQALSDSQLELAERTAQLQALRSEYDLVWNERLQGQGHPAAHPVVTRSIEDDRCVICGTKGKTAIAAIQERLDAHECPLCQSEVDGKQGKQPEELLTRLAELDKAITAAQAEIESAESVIVRLESELKEQRKALTGIVEKLAEFEKKNELAVVTTDDGPSGLKAIASRYRAQIADLQKERDEKRKERDRVRRELAPLQDELVRSYAAAEKQFVPAFNELARQFLGLDLAIDIEQSADTVSLVLSVEGTRRRAEDALSESQRFFVDIALRMALIQQMSAEDSPACLFVDTPEGSLDIAYESRAGEMFALFVERGHQLLMTANINTSQLLQRLARKCGEDGITLERMTEWTNLSEVQVAEEDAFEDAWQAILASLKPPKSSKGRKKKTSAPRR